MKDKFTVLQERTLNQSISLPILCPSMDLIAYGSSKKKGAIDGLSILRTLSWQRLVYIAGPLIDKEEDSDKAELDGMSSTCWSPDGRFLAVGLFDGSVDIYSVDECYCTGNVTPLYSTSTSIHAKEVFDTTSSIGNEKEGVLVLENKMTIEAAAASSDVSTNVGSPVVTRSVARRRQQQAKHVATLIEKGNIPGIEIPKEVPTNDSFLTEKVLQLVWVVMSDHPDKSSETKEENEVSTWALCKNYLDRDTHFLPSLVAEQPDQSPLEHACITSSTALSLLCVWSVNGYLHLFVHGQFPICSIPTSWMGRDSRTLNARNVSISSDLSTILLVRPIAMKQGDDMHMHTILSLYSTKSLNENKYKLQQISSSYISIQRYISQASSSLQQVCTQWSDALRPLDTKLVGLVDLLRDYGIVSSTPTHKGIVLRTEFLFHILSGNSSLQATSTPQTNNNAGRSAALNQYFANQSNEAVFTRLFKTLQQNLEIVESTIRKNLLDSCATRLLYLASELHGLASSDSLLTQHDYDLEEEATEQLLNVQKALELHTSIQCFYLSIQASLKLLVECRYRIKDLMTFLISIIATFKAEGTAADSFERKQAKKKRMNDSCLARVIRFLSGKKGGCVVVSENKVEDLIGIGFLDLLQSTDDILVDAWSDDKEDDFGGTHQKQTNAYPSIQTALQHVTHASHAFFTHSKQYMNQSVQSIDFILDSKDHVDEARALCAAVHTRIGKLKEGCLYRAFQPRICYDDTIISSSKKRGGMHMHSSYQWMLYARSTSIPTHQINQTNCWGVQIIAFPGSIQKQPPQNPYYLVSNLLLFPPECISILDISFYSDDGHSSLTPPNASSDAYHQNRMRNDTYTYSSNGGGEGERQSLCVLLQLERESEGVEIVAEELWVFSYDSVLFHLERYDWTSKDCIRITDCLGCEMYAGVTNIVDVEDIIDADGKDENYIGAKRRQIRTTERNNQDTSSNETLITSGSRGVAAIFKNNHTTTNFMLLDLEEDEDSASEEEDSMTCSEEGE